MLFSTGTSRNNNAVSRDGTVVARLIVGSADTELWIMDGEAQNKVLLAHLPKEGSQWGPLPDQLFVTGDSRAVVVRQGHFISKYPLDGTAPTLLLDTHPLNHSNEKMTVSPDGNLALVESHTDLGTVAYWLLDFVSGRIAQPADMIAKELSIPAHTQRRITWAPNSKLLVMSWKDDRPDPEPGKLYVVDAEFNVVKTFRHDFRGRSDSILRSTYLPSWSSDSTEFAFDQEFCLGRTECQIDTGTEAEAKDVSVMRGEQSAVLVANVLTGQLVVVESTRYKVGEDWADLVVWEPASRTLVRAVPDNTCVQAGGSVNCVETIDLDNAGKRKIGFVQTIDQPSVSPVRFSPGGTLLELSTGAPVDPALACSGSGPDVLVMSSLLNLTADLRAMRSAAGGGLILRGSAADANFARYAIEYARAAAPTVWKPVGPASTEAVMDKQFMIWMPPAYGNYLVRLSVEDKAGNTQRQIRKVSWSDTPPIADLYKDNEFISPNGDAKRDGVQLHYRVVEPVHLVFNVFDNRNVLIRTLAVDHVQQGVDAVFKWDGRDANGRVSADGEYRITVLDHEFFVTLDNTLPTIQAALSNPMSFVVDKIGTKRVKFNAILSWDIRDSYLSSLHIERSALGSDQWSLFEPLPVTDRKLGRNMLVGEVKGSKFRIVAEDKAGNVAVSPAQPMPQQLFLTGYDDHGQIPVGVAAPASLYPPYPVNATIGTIPLLGVFSGKFPVRFEYTQTLANPIAKVILQYRKILPAEKNLPLAAIATMQWEEMLISQFIERDPKGSAYLPVDGKVADVFKFLWPVKVLQENETYMVRVKVIDAAGDAFFAVAPYAIIHGDSPSLLTILDLEDKRPGSVAVKGELKLELETGDGLRSVEVLLKSSTDPRFATERVISTGLPVTSTFVQTVSEEALRDLDLRMCEPYSVRLKATTLSGVVLLSPAMMLGPKCLGADWIVTPDTALACNAVPSGKLNVRLMPYAADGRRLTQLLFGRILADGSYDVINNWNDVKTGGVHAFDLDTAGLSDGPASYFVRVINEDGKSDTKTILIQISHEAPEIRITSPKSGQKVCGVQMPNPYDLNHFVSAVAIEASVTSQSPVTFGLEYATAGQPEWRAFSPFAKEAWLDGFTNLRRKPPAREPADILCTYRDSALCGDFHPVQWASKVDDQVGEPARSGTLGHLGLVDKLEGEVSVRLRVFNGAGYQSCTAPVSFEFDNNVRFQPASVSAALFSPKAADGPTAVSVVIRPDENVNVDIDVLPATRGRDDIVIAGSVVARRLVKNLVQLSGEARFEWDGMTDLQALAPDGLYVLRITFTDSCGVKAIEERAVELDTTGPAVQLNWPLANAAVGLVTTLSGAIRDAHFASYIVEYASLDSPDSWVRVSAGNRATAPEAAEEDLGTLNSLGQTGALTLRVRALDRAGNATSVSVPLQLVANVSLITSLEPVPAVLSPNADGKRDTSAIRFGLALASKVTLEMRLGGVDGPLVRTLASEEAMEAGAASRSWDGMDADGKLVADGVLVAKLVATTSGPSRQRQEESVQLIVDTKAPLVTLKPVADFLAPRGTISVGTTDLHMQGYKAYVSAAPVGSKWKLIAEGESADGNTEVLSLDALEDGKYGVKVVALDQGDNATEVVKLFEIDSLAPKVTLAQPLVDSFLSARRGVVAIGATIEEKNLDSYELRFGQGAPGNGFTLLAGADMLSGPLVHAWNIAQVPDGAYTLWLSATDRAGQHGEAKLNVTIDNTAPRASLVTPAEHGVVGRSSKIEGVAADANLLQYTIEIAAGPKESASHWSLLHTGTAAVDGGQLFNWQAVPVDGVHTLRLSALDKAGNTTVVLREVVVDTVAPPALILAGALENRNQARLSWAASPAGDLAGYALYRDGVRINSVLLTPTSFVDPGLAMGNHTYTVRAIDAAGSEGDLSNPVTLTVTLGGPTARISSPGSGSMVGSLLDIKGMATASADFKEYRLYVGTGAAPAAWRLLRRSPAAVQDGVLASLDTFGLADNSPHSLKLEAEDLSGQVATAQISVTVDNVAPAAPSQLSAVANGNNVTLSWTPSTAPDLAGYIVLRDERVANAQGAVIGSWKPYLITSASHIDLDVGDGVRRYVVQAMDKAENMSAPSNTASVSIDTRAPHALMAQPLANSLISKNSLLLATTSDTDIASLQFQYRAQGAAGWIAIGAALLKAPFTLSWDAQGLIEGVYQIRAVATDKGGRTDLAPAPISVTYSIDPEVVTGLKAVVDGAAVTLTWNNPSSGQPSYLLERFGPMGDVVRISAAGAASPVHVDADLPDFAYRYRIAALGSGAQAGVPSDTVTATVYTPKIAFPPSPTGLAAFGLRANAGTAGKFLLEVSHNDQPAPNDAFDSDASGALDQPGMALEIGYNSYRVVHQDSAGNTSKAVTFIVKRVGAPAMPTGLAALASDGAITLHWNQNAEPDVVGYRVMRDGEADTRRIGVASVSASSQYRTNGAANASDGDPASWWTPDLDSYRFVDQQLMLGLRSRNFVTSARLSWAGGVVGDYAFLNQSGATLAEVRGNTGNRVETLFPTAVQAGLNLNLPSRGAVEPRLAEVELYGFETQSTTSSTFQASKPLERFRVFAVNDSGVLSEPAVLTFNAEASLPDLMVDAARILVSPAILHAGDAVKIAAVVANVGVAPAPAFATSIAVSAVGGAAVLLASDKVDLLAAGAAAPLSAEWTAIAGDYDVTVAADTGALVGERDRNNNSAVKRLHVEPASADVPLTLSISAPASGSALLLGWSAPGLDASTTYRIAAGGAVIGPFAALGDAGTSSTYLDSTARNGEQRFYVVSAHDASGSKLGRSAPVAGIARDRLAPGAPVILTPATAGNPLTLNDPVIDITGAAEPGATVSLLRGALVLDTVAANAELVRTELALPSPGAFDLSADGRQLASLVNESRLELRNLDTGSMTAVPGLPEAVAMRWSGDNRTLAVSTYDSRRYNDILNLYSMVDKSSVQVDAFTYVSKWFAWSPDDRQLALVGIDASRRYGLFLYDVATHASRLLDSDPGHLIQSVPRWTPDARHLAFVKNGKVTVVSTADGAVVYTHDSDSASPSWSADGSRLIFDFAGAEHRQIGEYALATGIARALTDGSRERAFPRWFGAEREFVHEEDGNAVLRTEDGVQKQILVQGNYAGADAIASPQRRLSYVSTDGKFVKVTLAGTFRSVRQHLKAGENVFSAFATDSSGNAGVRSAPVSITLAGAVPDMVASAGDIVVLPAAPARGEAARLTVTIRNGGTGPAANAGFALTVRDPQGATSTLAANTFATLAANETRAVTLDWRPAQEGEYSFVLSLDPLAGVTESNEANNVAVRTLVIAGAPSATVKVSTDAKLYGANAPFGGKVTLTNTGAQVDGNLTMRIEDMDGYLVEILAPAAVSLPYGRSADYPVTWHTGDILAGEYRLAAQLRGAGDVVIASGSAPFQIGAARSVSASVSFEQAAYRTGQAATIGASVQVAAGNASLPDASAHIQVFGSAGQQVFETTQALGSLLPGASSAFSALWNTGNAAPGTYQLKLDVLSGAASVASAQASTTIVAREAVVQMAGSVAPDSASVANGDRLKAAYNVTNSGTVDLAAVPLSVTVVDADSQSVIALVAASATLAPGASLQGEAGFDVTAWPLKTLQLVLSAELNGKSVVLQRSALRVVDRVGPRLAFLLAAQSGKLIAGAALPISVKADDSESLVASVEYAIGGTSNWLPFALQSRSDGLFSMSLAGLADGARLVQARATDSAGNVSDVANLDLIVDNTPPLIVVAGVLDGARYSAPVTPQVTLSDAHLLASTITLDGAGFVAGTVVAADGAHTLQVDAQDRAGNKSAQTVRFQIASTVPVLAITAPGQGSILRTPLNLTASATGDVPVVKVEYQLDAGAWSQAATDGRGTYGAAITSLADGPHMAAMRAVDGNAGVSAIAQIDFTIDNAIPVITVTGVLDGGSYSDSAVAHISVTDANLLSSKALLDGVAYVSGTAITKPGAHTLQLEADDKAGNKSVVTFKFQVALSAPMVAITSPAQGALLRTPLNVLATASSSASTISLVELQIDGASWTPASLVGGQYSAAMAALADGPHTLVARATDGAAQVALSQAVAVAIDNSAPVITVTGVLDGGSYSDSAVAHISVTDANLLSSKATLDGVAYVSGTAITKPGAHTLQLEADDKAGNKSVVTLKFQVALSAPIVAITSPAQGALLRTPFNVLATASSSASTTSLVELQVDGAGWTTAALVGGQYSTALAALTDGPHTLVARATDAAAQLALSQAVAVVVDNTAPVITVTGVTDGASYNAAVTPVMVVADANPNISALLLDGVPYVSGQPVAAMGAHTLVASASDKLGNKSELTIRFTLKLAVSGSLAAAPKPVTIGDKLTLAALVNNLGANALQGVQYRVTITDPLLAKVVFQADDVGDMAAGATYSRAYSWVASGAPGTVLKASLTATVAGQLLEIGVDTVTLAAAPMLSGEVIATPKEVAAGAIVAITQKLVNGGAALAGVAVELTIVNAQTNAVVFRHSDTVALAAKASWSTDLGWTVSGDAGTAYLIKLTASAAGKQFAIGQDRFVVMALSVPVLVSTGPFHPQRILILSQCKRAVSAGIGSCGVTPVVADDPVLLGKCDSERAVAVGNYLRLLGVSHKLVTSEDAFAREMKIGGYSGYWVSGGGTKLREPLQTELNAGLRLGEALLADGLHDLRDGDVALQNLLGVYSNGNAGLALPKLYMLGELYPVNAFDVLGNLLSVNTFDGYQVQGEFRSAASGGQNSGNTSGNGNGNGNGYGHCIGRGNGHDKDGDGIDDHGHGPCAPTTSLATAAIVNGSFGSGHTLFFAFDWAATINSGAKDDRWLDVGRTSFEWLKPVVDGEAPLIAGEVISRKIVVRNAGPALTLKVVVELPEGARALLAEPGATIENGAGVARATWQLAFGANQEREFTLQMKLPLAGGAYQLRTTVSSVTGSSASAAGSDTLALQVSGLAELGSAAQTAVGALHATGTDATARADALRWIGRALQSSAAGDDAQALRELVMAQQRLDRIDGETAGARQALARVVRAVERRQQ
ncbi:CARDB domain-containing protein [Massilia sp. TWP1-3-3]|uniref:CARDB domain-containing protein n=1 Tax=Massilia sp. TWP1-3-3 TaxID=2804573 RepID=UPI003CF9AAD4